MMTLEPALAGRVRRDVERRVTDHPDVFSGAMVLGAMGTMELVGRRAEATAEPNASPALLHHEVRPDR
jgi:hypothetical protein